MTWFPPLANGCLAQLPLQRRFVWRAITNQLENGERISLPDTGAGRIEWKLAYRELSTAERDVLSNFFRNARGAFAAFSFVDPTANLLGWSEDLSRPDWVPNLLTVATGQTSPHGTPTATRLTNSFGAAQQLTQTVALPGNYTACFSAWLRSDTPATIALNRGTARQAANATHAWKRFYVSAPIDGENNASFGLELQPGQSVDVWGLQAEAGPAPSQYRATAAASGIYERTSFAADELSLTATGLDLFATDFTLISRL